MKPRKRVLIYGASEHTRSILRLVLDVHGYRPLRGARLTRRTEVVLGVGLPEAREMAVLRWAAKPGVGSRYVAVKARGIDPEAKWMADLLLRVKLAARGVPGPVPRRAQ